VGPARTLSAATAILVAGCATAPDDMTPITREEVQTILDAQAAAWNRGDLAGFVSTYWDDPRLTFCGARGVVRGRQDLLATFERGYPTAEARGRLRFTLVEVRPLGTGAALVLGRYALDREAPAEGWFTLIVERTAQGLAITHDHSSGS